MGAAPLNYSVFATQAQLGQITISGGITIPIAAEWIFANLIRILLDFVSNVMSRAQKPDLVFRAKRTSPFKSARWAGRKFSRLLAAEVCGSAVSDCNIFSEYVYRSIKMSLKVMKKGVQTGGEREIVYNVYKFMKIESQVGNTISLSKERKRVVELTVSTVS